jgi:dihydrolipoamide dehydrogenase
VEAEKVGGVCLNVGCIPTKALLHAAETLHALKAGEAFGLKAEAALDHQKLAAWRDGVVKKLTGGVATLLKGNKVDLVQGFARLLGPKGLEFGQIYRRLGAEVTLIEYMPEILPQGDREIAGLLRRALEKEGIRVLTGTKALGYEKKKDGLHVLLAPAEGGKEETLVVDKVLVAVGRRPRTQGLGLEKAGIALDEKGFVRVNARMETSGTWPGRPSWPTRP